MINVEIKNLQTYSTYFSSRLGNIFIECTSDELLQVSFTNTIKKIEGDAAEAEEKNLLLQKCTEQLQEYFEGKRKIFDLPVSQAGTDFQKKVWNELLHIPYGNTISYMELSKRINNVKAIRAVGTSNGSNKLAIIVPCHRVVGSKGDLVGYAGELWRKKWLLDHEAKHAHGVRELF